MDLVDTTDDSVIELSELRLIPASVLASHLAILETATSAYRAELLKRPSHCRTAAAATTTGQAMPVLGEVPERLVHSLLPMLPTELWLAIFVTERQCWRRLRMCMVCDAWLRAIRDDPETWRALLVTHDRRSVLDLPTDHLFRRLVDDGALPILATDVRRLVPNLSWVTTVVLASSTFTEPWGTAREAPQAKLWRERRYIDYVWPVLSALCGLSFPSLRKLAMNLGGLGRDISDTEHFDVVFHWLREELPAGLEILKLGWVHSTLKQKYFPGLFDRYVQLKGLQLVAECPLGRPWTSDSMRHTMEVLVWGDCFYATEDELGELASLEKVRMVNLVMSAPEPEDLAKVCEAMPAGVKVLYLDWDGSEPFSLVNWSVIGLLQGLVELCVCLDSCAFLEGAGPAAITSHLARLLPKTTILIAEWKGKGADCGRNEIEYAPNLIDREFLPLRVPDWHYLQGVYWPPGRRPPGALPTRTGPPFYEPLAFP